MAPIALSALEHHAYCPRQAGLIHLDQVWSENVHTVRGDLAHHAVDLPGTSTRGGVRSVRSLPVSSHEHQLHGICDLVDFKGTQATPIEYKIGRHRPGSAADIQLAGQALCLREVGFDVPVGYVYSAADRRRHRVDITDDLIAATLAVVADLRRILTSRRLPPAVTGRRCRRCSLKDDCLPELTDNPNRLDSTMFVPADQGRWRD